MQVFTSNPGKRYAFSQVFKKLGGNLTKDELGNTLNDLVAQNKLRKIDDHKYTLSKRQDAPDRSGSSGAKGKGKDIIGIVDLNMSGNGYLIAPGVEQDIFIPRSGLNRAFDGDRVRVVIKKGHRGKSEGEVVEILDRARHDIVGTIELSGNYAYVITDKRKVPVDIFIPPDKVGEVRDGDRVIARITKWSDHKKAPEGEIAERLGAIGVNDVEMKSILVDNGFSLEFPDAVHNELAAMGTTISEDEIARRRDMRDVVTFTIDPEDAKDFDDALSLQKLDNGHWEVGVHIADVSHYVRPGTELDKAAYTRGTSVYLVDRVLPMLPEELSNIICSLRPDEDKLTYSAIFELDDEGEVYSRWFGRTVIRSNKRFTYEDAQERIETNKGELAKEINILNRISLKLREKKFANGAIAFETVEVKFKVDLDGVPLGVVLKERKEAHMLIEDFMLLANKEVAKHAGKRKHEGKAVPFVYRIHDQPDIGKLKDFSRFAAMFGYKVNIDSPKQISKSLNRLMEQIKGKPEQDLLEQLAIRSMAKAVYTTKNIGHYGLGFEYYTHFTSPIRRYPDVLVHRIMSDILSDKPFKPVDKLEDKCVRCSWMERKAMDAERESVKFKQAEFMSNHIGEVFDGLITGVQHYGLFVEALANKCEGLVDVDSIPDDHFMHYEKENALIGRVSGKRYRLGDRVQIRVVKTDIQTRRIDFELAE